MGAPSNIALRYVQRRVLLLSLIPLALLFALTATLASTYHLREAGLVQEWTHAGDQDMSAGQPDKALEDFRNALAYDSENNAVQLRLAEALLAGDRLPEARSYLLNLWDRSPGSGEINLDLARVSMHLGDQAQAIRYFRTAIYGVWEKDPAQQRRKARRELYDYLISQGRTSDAEAELAGLAADTPSDGDK
jgi:predicted Zn-dependent protease